GVDVPSRAKGATAKLPGDRPTAARVAGWGEKRVPLDAAYVLVRLAEIERAARRGTAPVEGRARAWTEGLPFAHAGLDELARDGDAVAARGRDRIGEGHRGGARGGRRDVGDRSRGTRASVSGRRRRGAVARALRRVGCPCDRLACAHRARRRRPRARGAARG